MNNLELETQPVDLERQLVAASQKGDEDAFGELCEIWASRVYRFVYIRVKDVAAAEDLTSEIFLKAWQKIHQYKPRVGAKFSSWLYTIARNSIVDYYRIARRVELSFEDLPEIADLEGNEPYAEAGRLETALKQLPADYEKVLRLRFVEGFEIAKVAQMMRKKESNVRALTHRAIQKIKQLL